MHRRSRCVVFREHRRSAPREALDPGQGEALLGQALHEKPVLRFSECSGQDSAELLIFPKCWRRARVEFSPSPDASGWRAEFLILPDFWQRARVELSPGPNAYPDIFHPRLEFLSFPEGWRPARVRYSPSRGTNLSICRPILEPLVFPRDRWPPCGIFTKPWRQAAHFLHTP